MQIESMSSPVGTQHDRGWSPMSCAPKDGTIVRLRDKNKLYNCVMSFDRVLNKWIGMAYSMFGASRTEWDESFCPIYEWQHVSN